MEINIENYLSESEIKEIVIYELREQIKKHFDDENNAQRLLSNLSYQIVFDEIDKHVPGCRELITKKTEEIIHEIGIYHVFRDKSYGSEASLAHEIMEDVIRKNKDLINEKVKETIISKDYSDEIWRKFEELGETFIDNIYEIVRMGRTKTEEKQ